MTEEEERFVKRQYEKLPYMYLALLEYCSELTGETIKDIDTQMAWTILGDNFPTGEKLNG